MFNNIQSVIYSCVFLIASLFLFDAPLIYSQFEGVSIHGDILSFNIPNGFGTNYFHPGNFLVGLQYNFPINKEFELNTGFDFIYTEATGLLNNEIKEVEVFIPSAFGGFLFRFDNWGFFGKAGYAPAGSINQRGSQGWVSTIPGFDIYPIQVGVKFNVTNDLDLTTTVGHYIGKSIKINNNQITLNTMNIGLSYNLFGSHAETPIVDNNYKQMYNEVVTENDKLEKQNSSLVNQISEILGRLNKPGEVADSVVQEQRIKLISLDSINSVYNLHIGHPLNIATFVNRNRISEDGKLILGEYNSIASTFRDFPYGIWLFCYVPDTNVFLTSVEEFPRIEFKRAPGFRRLC